jgi:hypothetical protein
VKLITVGLDENRAELAELTNALGKLRADETAKEEYAILSFEENLLKNERLLVESISIYISIYLSIYLSISLSLSLSLSHTHTHTHTHTLLMFLIYIPDSPSPLPPFS